MNKKLQRASLALVLAGAIALAFVYRDRIDAATLEAWVAGAGVAGPVLFIALYALATVLFLPGAVAYTYLGYAGREAVAGGEGLIEKGLIALALLAAAA